MELQTPTPGSAMDRSAFNSTTALASSKGQNNNQVPLDASQLQESAGTTSDEERQTPPPSEQGENASGLIDGRPEFSLPAADSGKDAWLFLLASFIMEALVWGKMP